MAKWTLYVGCLKGPALQTFLIYIYQARRAKHWFACITWHLPAEDVFRCCWLQFASPSADVHELVVFMVSMYHLAVHFDLVNSSMLSNAHWGTDFALVCIQATWARAGKAPGRNGRRALLRTHVFTGRHTFSAMIFLQLAVWFCAPLSIQ